MISSRNTATFNWNADPVDGQIAQAVHGGKAENFLWDDLALVHRGETSFVNEPYVTGGNPILSSRQGVMFNDMLGTTLGTKQGKFKSVQMTAFGETKDTEALFTGKPYIGELGYAFLFRNYRADKGKWLTSDPLGYPDGWNNFAYCKNNTTHAKDTLGLCQWVSDTGTIIYVPINEQDPIGNTPDGYTFVPCHSTVTISTTTYVPYQYYSNTIFVSCKEPLHVFIPRWEGDSGDDFHYVFNFYCGNDDIENHNGMQIIKITMSVYLNPEIREYNCLRKEIIGYHRPNTSFELTYAYSAHLIKTVLCE